MAFYEVVNYFNFLISAIASIGYLLRIITKWKEHDLKHRIMLLLFLLVSIGASGIYFSLITNLWLLIEPDFETYSRVYVKPYFTFLGSVLVLSAWTHPELNPIIKKAKEYLWILLGGNRSKKP